MRKFGIGSSDWETGVRPVGSGNMDRGRDRTNGSGTAGSAGGRGSVLLFKDTVLAKRYQFGRLFQLGWLTCLLDAAPGDE